jgi:hypothetical protein
VWPSAHATQNLPWRLRHSAASRTSRSERPCSSTLIAACAGGCSKGVPWLVEELSTARGGRRQAITSPAQPAASDYAMDRAVVPGSARGGDVPHTGHRVLWSEKDSRKTLGSRQSRETVLRTTGAPTARLVSGPGADGPTLWWLPRRRVWRTSPSLTTRSTTAPGRLQLRGAARSTAWTLVLRLPSFRFKIGTCAGSRAVREHSRNSPPVGRSRLPASKLDNRPPRRRTNANPGVRLSGYDAGRRCHPRCGPGTGPR